jgi:hypothetical protein
MMTGEEPAGLFALLGQHTTLRANMRRALRNLSRAELAHLEATLREALDAVTETTREQERPT